MSSQMLQRILRRFKKDDFKPVLEKWEDTGQEILKKVDLTDTKQSMITNISKLCEKRKVTTKSIGLLDMIYMQSHASRVKWSVYQLNKPSGEEYDLADTKEFESRLHKQLDLYFNFDMCVDSHAGAIWSRVYIHENRFLQSNVIYIVYYPQTPVVLLSKVKVSHQDYVLQALMNVLDATSIKDCHLTGYHMDSLAELILNKCSQGGFSKYRLDKDIPNALDFRRGKKRRREDTDSLDERIVCEYKADHSKREEELDDTFGTNAQPTLEKLIYQLDTRFRGTDMVPGMQQTDKPFKCRAKFEGPNVLEGVRNMARCGLATLPLPKHLGEVHSLARNHFVISDKKKRTANANESTSKQ